MRTMEQVMNAMEQANKRSKTNILKDRKGEIAELVNLLEDGEIPEFPVSAFPNDSSRGGRRDKGLLLGTNKRLIYLKTRHDKLRDVFQMRYGAISVATQYEAGGFFDRKKVLHINPRREMTGGYVFSDFDDDFKPFMRFLRNKMKPRKSANSSKNEATEKSAEMSNHGASEKPADDSNNETANFSVADELTKLADLVDRGVLTDEEFAQQKARLLS